VLSSSLASIFEQSRHRSVEKLRGFVRDAEIPMVASETGLSQSWGNLFIFPSPGAVRRQAPAACFLSNHLRPHLLNPVREIS
jgi:hypothetical protein